jgi:hypothetical protein
VTRNANEIPFSLLDTVRLRNPHGDIPAETLGRILGRFVGEGTYVVDFADAGSLEHRVAEVRPDEIALAEFS